MTAVEDWTLVDAHGDDPSTLASLDREAITRAIRLVARATGGIVTAAQVRAAIDQPIKPQMFSGVMSGLAKSGALIDTGRMAPSGDRANRNARRRLPVWSVPNLEVIK